MVANAKQGVEREHNQLCLLPEMPRLPFLLAMEGVSALLVQGWEGRLGNHVFFPYTLLKPSPIYCKTRLHCQSNAK